MGNEIERKYLIHGLPFQLSDYPCHEIEQAYLNTEPVIRIRRQDNDYYLTYKSKGLMVRREENLPLDADSYRHLLKKADGNIITKTRYKIPFDNGLTIEIDVLSRKISGTHSGGSGISDRRCGHAFIPSGLFRRGRHLLLRIS